MIYPKATAILISYTVFKKEPLHNFIFKISLLGMPGELEPSNKNRRYKKFHSSYETVSQCISERKPVLRYVRDTRF